MTHKREIQGKVIAKSGDQTVRISVERRVLHSRYHKIVKKFKSYLVHDPKNEAEVNDIVTAIECRPVSKRKSFRVVNVEKAEVAE